LRAEDTSEKEAADHAAESCHLVRPLVAFSAALVPEGAPAFANLWSSATEMSTRRPTFTVLIRPKRAIFAKVKREIPVISEASRSPTVSFSIRAPFFTGLHREYGAILTEMQEVGKYTWGFF
jgi:hypothetical protein